MYITQPVCYASAEEFAIMLAGHEVYHFLRDSRQIPGRNSEPSANRYGLSWLEEFRHTFSAGTSLLHSGT
jgi:hypothetical protein